MRPSYCQKFVETYEGIDIYEVKYESIYGQRLYPGHRNCPSSVSWLRKQASPGRLPLPPESPGDLWGSPLW